MMTAEEERRELLYRLGVHRIGDLQPLDPGHAEACSRWTVNHPTPTRTAEDERRDVLAFLAAEEAKQDSAIVTFANAGDERAADRSGVRASLVRSIRAYIERGDHMGAANR